MKRISSYFLQGILLVAPVAITIYILYAILKTVDSWLVENIKPILGFYVPGLGVLILFVALTILGFIGQTTVFKPLKKIAGKIILKIPILNLLYSSLNDLFSAFMGKEKKFNVPVKVRFNKENNLWKLGFITKESLDEFELSEMAAVYFPHSYNFSGELYLVPSEQIETLNLSPAEVMKFIVSGGVTRIEAIEK
ncbi:DUF502 domain-containing protein [Maribellus comscasis]|uniref:DUF502 domain-containing protein n=1 Tax=Maribellus comscasis TaxID=2681766 RepID=A0A6I6JUW5_9BACT|nr:DUF502 domain-containing protein [Maribellus comscasis]QGY46915.1 DUF502 domain-containing protein [Maribellus comscasis]